MSLTVVKLGGSHALSPLLRPWLEVIEREAGRVVLVPGGGPFADAVRAAQPAMRFDDRTAHDMALLAMAQYGLALVSLGTRLVVAETRNEICAARVRGQVAVWSPAPMLRAAPDVPACWDVTSDSLALWLAKAIGAERVVLIKHRAPESVLVDDLAKDGLVDAAFPRFAARFAGRIAIAGPDDLERGTLDGRAIRAGAEA